MPLGTRFLPSHADAEKLLLKFSSVVRYSCEFNASMDETDTSCRHMLGEDLSMLKVNDLVQLEQELALGASRVRARKASTI